MSSGWVRIAFALLAVLLYAQAPGGKRISIYTAQTSYSLPVIDHDGAEYVGLFEVLEPMGTGSARVDKHKWRLKFRDVEGEFEEGKTRARVVGKNVELGAPFVLQNNRGLVPVRSLPALVSAFAGVPADLHGVSRRLFVGATPVRYSAQVQKDAAPRLVLNFSSPVNPFIATEHGAVRMVFARDPVVSGGSDQTNLGDPVFPSSSFAETNGAAELTVHVTVPVIASFSNANRTITLSPVNAPAQSAANAPGASAAVPAQPTPPGVPSATPGPAVGPGSRRPAFYILIDPAHGGTDRGAALSDSLAEKDAVLTIARRLRADLEARGIQTRLLRDGDVDIPADRRALAINTSRPAAVVFVHASTVGNGIHISTAALPASLAAAPLWETAQSASLLVSRAWADAVAAEVFKRNIAVLRLRGSVPPLNQTAVPAFILEVTPPPTGRPTSILSGEYLAAISGAVTAATAAERDRLSAGAH